MLKTYELLQLLSDGRFHSGEALGQTLGVTRGTVWNHLRDLRALGIDVFAVPRKGYRLPQSIELLSADTLRGALAPAANTLLSDLDIFLELPSTNAWLVQQAQRGAARGRVCLAECQSAGRGRRGRTWVSPPGGNVYLSVLWRFESGAAAVQGLSLAVGVAVAEALVTAGVPDVGLKWPNDVVCQGKKLAGVLLEMAGESAGPCYVVVGIGINVSLNEAAARTIDQPWIDVATVTQAPIARNALVAAVISQVLIALRDFEREGLAQFLPRWRAHDVFAGKSACLQMPNELLNGTVDGIDDRGALLFSCAGGTRAYAMGELSLRAVR